VLVCAVLSMVSASVEVAPTTPCVDASFTQKLASAGVVVPGDATLTLRPARTDVLEVTLSLRGTAPLRREVPSTLRDCAGVDRVVVALVKAWLSSAVPTRPVPDGGTHLDGNLQQPARGKTEAIDEPASADRGTTTSETKVRPVDAGVTTQRAAVLPADDKTSDTTSGIPPRVMDSAVPGSPVTLDDAKSSISSDAGIDGGIAVAALVVDPPLVLPKGKDTRRWRFGAGLLGGIATGPTSDIVPQGVVSVDVARGWFGAALDVGLSGTLSRQVAPGTVSSSWQWVSLSARAVWAPLPRLLFEVQLGARGQRIVAVAKGYSETKPEQQQLSVGAVGSLGVCVLIIGPVGLTVRATGVIKPRERFIIDNLGPILDLEALEGGVHAGVVARW
jgi:hypothetical protein